jgi:TatD DNase family protein
MGNDLSILSTMLVLNLLQCEMRPSHASAKYLKDAPPLPKAVKKERFVKGSMVKGRNEPATIPHVAYAIAKIKDITVEEVCEA